MSKKLELERKFLFDSDFEEKLIKINSFLVESVVLHDEYYDNESNHFLTLNDCWLRSRNSKWELKYPRKLKDQNNQIDNYFELSNDNEIINFIYDLSKPYFDNINYDELNNFTIEHLLSNLKLTRFATINSNRKTYKINHDIKIDLDITDFDYRLGEIEIVLEDKSSNQDEINQAIEKINHIAQLFGIKDMKEVPGKMSVWLFKNNFELYQLLTDKLIITKAHK